MNYEQSAKAQTERLMADGHATILAIESSCDETAAAIVRDGRQVISSVISSQIPLHAMYGGVVPEIASRAHVESVDPVVDEALKKAGMTLADVDAVAVTYGPGLVGALLIGVSAAKALAYAADFDLKLLPYENARGMAATKEQVEAVRPGMNIAVFIGPEGGFEEAEVEEARAAGFYPVSLGKRILRTETAGLTMLSILMYQMEITK